MEIQSSAALEAFGLFSVYLDNYVQKEESEYPIPMDPQIESWVRDIDASISRFLKNDLELLFSKNKVNSWLIFHIIQKNSLTSTEKLLDYIKGLSPEEFRGLYLKIIKLQDVPLEKITQKAIKESLERTFFSDARGEEKNVYHLLKNPEEWKTRIVDAYESFYRDFFLPRLPEVETILHSRLAEAQKKLDEDPDKYLEALSVGHYKTMLHSARDLQLYASYCLDRGFTISIKEKIFWFGLRRELLLDEMDRKTKTDLLFRTLSDPKRLEILRLISVKTWYSNELAKHFGITSATMSYHINKLISAGLLTFELGEHNKIYYQVNTEILGNLLDAAREDLLGSAG